MNCILSILCLLLALIVDGHGQRLLTRANDPLDLFHGAILLRNGRQTSCEIGLISNRFGYVAASCFQLDNDLKVVNVSQYEVLFDGGSDSPTPGRFGVANITINPGYDPKTYVNNIAVVAFKSQSTKLWTNYIDRNPREKTDHLFVRRSVSDVLAQKWNRPSSANVTDANYVECNRASASFFGSPYDFWCISDTTQSPVDGLCNVPYGLAYGVIGKDMTVSGIYSHSATVDDKMCGSTQQYHYYTLLYNFNIWAAQYVPDHVMVFSTSKTIVNSNATSYSMGVDMSIDQRAIKLFAGDVFARDTSSSLWVEATETSATLTSGSPTPTSVAVKPSLVPQNSPSGSLTKSQVIAIAVAVPLATIIALVAIFFAYKHWMRHKKSVAWDPSNETQAMRIVALDLASSEVPTDAPPTYDTQNFSVEVPTANNLK